MISITNENVQSNTLLESMTTSDSSAQPLAPLDLEHSDVQGEEMYAIDEADIAFLAQETFAASNAAVPASNDVPEHPSHTKSASPASLQPPTEDEALRDSLEKADELDELSQEELESELKSLGEENAGGVDDGLIEEAEALLEEELSRDEGHRASPVDVRPSTRTAASDEALAPAPAHTMMHLVEEPSSLDRNGERDAVLELDEATAAPLQHTGTDTKSTTAAVERPPPYGNAQFTYHQRSFSLSDAASNYPSASPLLENWTLSDLIRACKAYIPDLDDKMMVHMAIPSLNLTIYEGAADNETVKYSELAGLYHELRELDGGLDAQQPLQVIVSAVPSLLARIRDIREDIQGKQDAFNEDELLAEQDDDVRDSGAVTLVEEEELLDMDEGAATKLVDDETSFADDAELNNIRSHAESKRAYPDELQEESPATNDTSKRRRSE